MLQGVHRSQSGAVSKVWTQCLRKITFVFFSTKQQKMSQLLWFRNVVQRVDLKANCI